MLNRYSSPADWPVFKSGVAEIGHHPGGLFHILRFELVLDHEAEELSDGFGDGGLA